MLCGKEKSRISKNKQKTDNGRKQPRTDGAIQVSFNGPSKKGKRQSEACAEIYEL
jgi:hypothetical protein